MGVGIIKDRDRDRVKSSSLSGLNRDSRWSGDDQKQQSFISMNETDHGVLNRRF